MNSITSKTFEILCFEKDEGEEVINVPSIEIKGRVKISNKKIENDIVISGCTFIDSVTFENIICNSDCSIRFFDCTFKQSIHIKSWKTNIVKQDEYDFDNCSIKFENTAIEELLNLESLNLKKGIHFTAKTSVHRLNCKAIKLGNGDFLIDNSIVNLVFDLVRLEASNLNIKNGSVINAKIRFTDIRADIFFNDSEFTTHTFLSGCNTETLAINNSIFNEEILISSPLISEMYISESEFKKEVDCSINASNHFVGKLEISQSKFSDKFILKGGRSMIKNLKINFSKELEGVFHFNFCRIGNIILTGENYNTNVIFNNSEFQSLLFNNFSNYANISFNSSKALNSESDLIVRYSNLGKTHFFNFSFNDFKYIVIDNSVLIDIITVNVKWFNGNQLITSSDNFQKFKIYQKINYCIGYFKKLESISDDSKKIEFYQEINKTIKWIDELQNLADDHQNTSNIIINMLSWMKIGVQKVEVFQKLLVFFTTFKDLKQNSKDTIRRSEELSKLQGVLDWLEKLAELELTFDDDKSYKKLNEVLRWLRDIEYYSTKEEKLQAYEQISNISSWFTVLKKSPNYHLKLKIYNQLNDILASFKEIEKEDSQNNRKLQLQQDVDTIINWFGQSENHENIELYRSITDTLMWLKNIQLNNTQSSKIYGLLYDVIEYFEILSEDTNSFIMSQDAYKILYWFNNKNQFEEVYEKIYTLHGLMEGNTISDNFIQQKELQDLLDILSEHSINKSFKKIEELTHKKVTKILFLIKKIKKTPTISFKQTNLYVQLYDILNTQLEHRQKDSYELVRKTTDISHLFKKLKLGNLQTKELYAKIDSILKLFTKPYIYPNDTQAREIYRQIRFVLERQGDKIAALKFKSIEMETHKKEVFNKFQYDRFQNLQDKIILLSGWTNDFGRSWFKPVLLMIPITIFFYCLIITGVSDELSYYPSFFTLQSWSITLFEYYDNINIMPQLLDPTHSLSRIFIDNKNIEFWAYFFDYLYKIILAFFIYQVISAFRKYVT